MKLTKWKDGKEVELTPKEVDELQSYRAQKQEKLARRQQREDTEKALARSAAQKLIALGLTRQEIRALRRVINERPTDD